MPKSKLIKRTYRILPRQDVLVKKISKKRKQSESDVVRDAIDNLGVDNSKK